MMVGRGSGRAALVAAWLFCGVGFCAPALAADDVATLALKMGPADFIAGTNETAAQYRADSAAAVAKVPADAHPVDASLLIALPRAKVMEPMVESVIFKDEPMRPGVVAAFAKFFHARFAFDVDVLVKSRMFRASEVRPHGDRQDPGMGGNDYLLWYRILRGGADGKGEWAAGWMMRRAGSSRLVMLSYEPTDPPGPARAEALLKAVHEAVATLGAPP